MGYKRGDGDAKEIVIQMSRIRERDSIKRNIEKNRVRQSDSRNKETERERNEEVKDK